MTAENLVHLLPLARELSDTNKILQDRESILRQLTLLKNVNSIQKSSSGLKSSIFQVESSVHPGVQCENIVVTIRHILAGYDFDPRFWSFHLSISGEKKACCWNLSKMFIEGDCEKFSTQILPRFNLNSKCQSLTISLGFCMQWTDVNYSTVFPLHHFDIDLLNLLNPGARAGSLVAPLPSNTLREYPPITKFSLRTSERVFEMFIVDILLKDVNESRCFGLKGTTGEIMKTGDFVAYVGQDRITVSGRKDGRTFVLTFKSSNSQVLRLFKAAVYYRMLRLCESDVLRLKSCSTAGDKLDELDGLRLRLELLGDTKGESSRVMQAKEGESWSSLVQSYHELRAGSEALIEFRHVLDTKVVSR